MGLRRFSERLSVMHVLYLDYDGVLHPDSVYYAKRRGVYLAGAPGHALFEYAHVLETLLAPFSELRIVLSTSWVPVLDYSKAKGRLPPSLQRRVIGATFHSREMRRDEFLALHRGTQVIQDVYRRHPADWIAIDDVDEGWPDAHRHRVVLTDSSLGLGEERAQLELSRVLAQFFHQP